MTVHDVDLSHEALADYSLLLAEAATVLAAMANATDASERSDEFADLRAIHEEGAGFALPGALAADLRRLFDGVEALADSIVHHPAASLPAQADRIEQVTHGIAAALDQADPALVDLTVINQALSGLDPRFVGATDLRSAVAAAADLVDVLH